MPTGLANAAWDWTGPSLRADLAALLLHLAFNQGYGIFRDELYFIVCGQRLAWGCVDQPPLIPMLAAWSRAPFPIGWLASALFRRWVCRQR